VPLLFSFEKKTEIVSGPMPPASQKRRWCFVYLRRSTPHLRLHASEDGIEKDEIDKVDRIEKGEIDQVVKLLPSHKALGPDGFNTDFIRRCCKSFVKIFIAY